MTELYETLGVGKGATPDEIKRAYRNLAKKHHPDAGGDRDQFHALQLAYDVLSDDQRRAHYDETGDTGQQRERDPNEMALEVLARLVDDLVQQIVMGNDLEFADLAKQMRLRLDGQVAEIKNDQNHARDFERKATKIRQRFKAKKGPDYIGQMLEEKLRVCRQALDNAEKKLAIFDRAKQLLADVDFEVEKRPETGTRRETQGYAESVFGQIHRDWQRATFFGSKGRGL